ncbi:MAG TPA: porin [Opitutaceae bacterium]|nr:porin [Opitutaceae bacterium]
MSVLLASTTLALPRLAADERDDIKALRAQIDSLEQKLDVLEKKQEISDQKAAEAAKAAPKVSLTGKGFVFTSADGANSLHIGALVQFDSREYLKDGGGLLNNTFLLRRARPVLDGTLDKIYTFQFVPEFGGTNPVSVFDANVGIAPTKELQFKFGKFKAPIGLEQLQGDPATSFVERSLVNNLVPSRDLGAQVTYTLKGGVLTGTVGIFNGVADGANTTNQDFDNDKDVDARLFSRPFVNAKDSPLHGLGAGVAGSFGREKGAPALTGGYKSDGQQTFFKYKSTVAADGQVWRISPQAYYYYGPFGALGEYAVSTVNVRPTLTGAGAKTQLENKAWQASVCYVLTGEDASYTGVTPAEPFSWADGTWGAWQVVARYADLKVDPKAFPLFADATSTGNVNAREASSFGIGLNWYLNNVVRISQDYFQTQFTNSVAPSAATPILRQDEKALITRVQLSF